VKKLFVVVLALVAIGYGLWHLGLIGRAWGSDPCKLLTKQDAEAALGGAVDGPHTKAVKSWKSCGYRGQGDMESVTLNMEVRDPCADLTDIADPSIIRGGTQLSGIGDEAVASSMSFVNAIYVRKKNVCFYVIATDYDARRSPPIPAAQLRNLAQTAATRLP